MTRTVEELSKEFRRLCKEGMTKLDSPDAPICLSGGIDSNTMLFTSLNLGYKPQCYTFQLGDYENADVKSAKNVCKAFDVEHFVAKCPQNDEQLVEDIKTLFRTIEDSHRKVFMHTAHCMLYLAREIHNHGKDVALTGDIAGGAFGADRESQFEYNRGGNKLFMEHRNRNIDNRYKTSFIALELSARSYDVQLLDPLDNIEFIEWAKTLTHDECMKPFPKAVSVYAFKEYWKKGNFLRTPSSMQIGTGVRDWHRTLIKSKYNVGNHKDLTPIYKYMYELYERGKL